MKKKILALGLSALVASTLMAKEIKVGILQPLTGPIASFGQKTLDGIKLIHEKELPINSFDSIVRIMCYLSRNLVC